LSGKNLVNLCCVLETVNSYIGEEKESLKFDSGEEIKLSTECTYLGTKIDQTGDNTTVIKHRINQTRKL
jgi:hypothetical protein